MKTARPTIDLNEFYDDEIERVEIDFKDSEIIVCIGNDEILLRKRELELMLKILNEGEM